MKRMGLIFGMLVGMTAATFTVEPAAAADLIPVKQAGFKVVDMALPFLAKSKGFFEKNGLDWQYVEIDSGKLGVAALISGNVQFVDLGMDDIGDLQEQGKDPVGFYSLANSLTMDLVLSNKAIAKNGVDPTLSLDDKLKKLKGLTFGITRPGAPTQVFIQYMMKKVGLDPEKDANFVQVGGGQALVAAVKAGRVDGFLLSAPAPYILERDKVGTVVVKNSSGEGPPELKDFAFETVSVLKSYAAANPNAVAMYCKSMDEAYDWMLTHHDEAIDALQKYFPETDRATLTLSFDVLVPAMSVHGKLSQAAVQNQFGVLTATGALSKTPDSKEGVLWTNQYCK